MLKWDGHTHTPYCPHGSTDTLEAYIQRAITLGFDRYSITEHAPLPASFRDPVPTNDSAMPVDQLADYLHACRVVKDAYASQIDILIGLEVDYIIGFEEETTAFLNEIGPELDDALLAVHFLPIGANWVCIDYDETYFESNIVPYYSSIDHLYYEYYSVMRQAVEADLGPYKPNRIAHLSLIEKYKKKFPAQSTTWVSQAHHVLDQMKANGYSLDYNTAGVQKPLCKEPYPSADLFHEAHKRGIPFVYGSDAHQSVDVGHHYTLFQKQVLNQMP